MTRRKRWLVVMWIGVAALSISTIAAVLKNLGSGNRGYENMRGPVAIVRGDPPKHGFLGVEFNRSSTKHLMIKDILPGSGAADAGVRAGDEVAAIGTVKDPNYDDAQRVLAQSKPGDLLPLTVRRGSEEVQLQIKLIDFATSISLSQADARSRR
jgi:S1-C subfamily serine protease